MAVVWISSQWSAGCMILSLISFLVSRETVPIRRMKQFMWTACGLWKNTSMFVSCPATVQFVLVDAFWLLGCTW